MNLCSVKYFIEIVLTTITNCMEGYIHKQKLKKRIKNTLKEIDSPRQELTFNQLKIYYEEHGCL